MYKNILGAVLIVFSLSSCSYFQELKEGYSGGCKGKFTPINTDIHEGVKK